MYLQSRLLKTLLRNNYLAKYTNRIDSLHSMMQNLVIKLLCFMLPLVFPISWNAFLFSCLLLSLPRYFSFCNPLPFFPFNFPMITKQKEQNTVLRLHCFPPYYNKIDSSLLDHLLSKLCHQTQQNPVTKLK